MLGLGMYKGFSNQENDTKIVRVNGWDVRENTKLFCIKLFDFIKYDNYVLILNFYGVVTDNMSVM